MLCASHGDTIGGMETQVLNMLRVLSRQSDIKYALTASEQICQQVSKKTASFKLPLHLSRNNPILLFQLFEVIRKFKPDLIHCHGQKAAQLVSRLKLISPNCIRVVTLHGDKRRTKEMKSFDAVITVSKHLHQKLKKKNIKSHLIENGVQLFSGKRIPKAELCEQYDLDPELPLFIAAGRLAPVKNFGMLMAAFANIQASLIVFGDGPDYDNLSKLTRPNVRLAGHHPNVRQVYQSADAMLITSLREGMSLSMIEALTQNTLVLSSPVSGAQNLLPKSCLLNIKSQKKLKQDLDKKIAQLSTLKKDSAKAFSYAGSHLTMERMCRETHSLYTSFLRASSK